MSPANEPTYGDGGWKNTESKGLLYDLWNRAEGNPQYKDFMKKRKDMQKTFLGGGDLNFGQKSNLTLLGGAA